MQTEPKALTFPDALDGPWFWVLDIALKRSEITEVLGPPHTMLPEDGTGDADWWAFQYPCGLRLLYGVTHETELAAASANLPQPEHAKRHVPFPQTACTVPATDVTAPNHEYTLHQFSTRIDELNHLRDFQVWRMGDDGNETKIGFPTSYTDGRCLVAEFESHHHKQIYWVSRCVNVST